MILYILILLQVLDVASTLIALRNPKLTEGNVLLKPLFDAYGAATVLVVVKLFAICLLFWAEPVVPVEILYILVAFYCWVVFNNVKLIRNT